jgi:Carbonic anhydrase
MALMCNFFILSLLWLGVESTPEKAGKFPDSRPPCPDIVTLLQGSATFPAAFLRAQWLSLPAHRDDLLGHIADLVRAMKPGIEPRQRAVVANVRFNVQRLQEATPILADMVKAGKLRVVGAVYDLPTGKVALV